MCSNTKVRSPIQRTLCSVTAISKLQMFMIRSCSKSFWECNDCMFYSLPSVYGSSNNCYKFFRHKYLEASFSIRDSALKQIVSIQKYLIVAFLGVFNETLIWFTMFSAIRDWFITWCTRVQFSGDMSFTLSNLQTQASSKI